MTEHILAKIRNFFSCKYATPIGSGTVGLKVALQAIGVQDRRVILPALVCPNVAVAVLSAGGIPVAIDMSQDDYDFDISTVADAIDKFAAAIIAVDIFGHPSNINGLREVSAGSNCMIIDDACHAYGGYSDGKPVGGRGDIGVVSFGYSKPIQLMGGGIVLTNSPELYGRIEAIRSTQSFRRFKRLKNRIALKYMMKNQYKKMYKASQEWELLSYDFPQVYWRRLPNAWCKFVDNLDGVRANLDSVREIVAGLPGVVPFNYKEDQWLPWRYSFKVPNTAQREKIIQTFTVSGIRTSRLYRPVTEFLEVETHGTLSKAHELCEVTVNIIYETTLEDTHILLQRLEGAKKRLCTG